MTDERIHSPVVFICATCNKEFTTRAAVMTHFEPRDSCVIKQVSIRKIPVQQVTNGMIIDTNYDADGTPREPTKTPEQIEAENAAARKVLLERYNRDIKVTDESHALELQRRQDAEDMENNRW
jgi:ribosomal protein L31